MHTRDDTTELPRHLLGIWPHPDDEAYLSAGLMARMTDAGREVTVLTLTRGEKGTSDAVDYDQPHFGARREAELRASLAQLGVHDVRVAGYRDGECDTVDSETAVRHIAGVIASVRPDVVVTFGPDGITGHPDHRIVSGWVTEAWRRVGGAELLYATMTDDFVAINAELHDRIGLFGDTAAGPAAHPLGQMAIVCELSGAELDRKRRALAGHGSQTAALAELMGEDAYRRWWHTEWFRRPTAAEASSSAVCTTLTAGSTSAVPA